MKNYNEENNIDRDEVLAFAFRDIINEDSKISKYSEDIKSQLSRLFMHMIKYVIQKDHQTSSWIRTIIDSSSEIIKAKNKCKSAYDRITEDILIDKYNYAMKKASGETGIDIRDFPMEYRNYPPNNYFTKNNIFNANSIERFLHENAYTDDAKRYLGL